MVLKGGEEMDLDMGRNNVNNGRIFKENRRYRIVSPNIARMPGQSGAARSVRNTNNNLSSGSQGLLSHPGGMKPDCGGA